MDTAQAYYIVAALLVLAGLAGLILPALPGSPLIFAGLFLAAWAEDFTYVGAGTLIVLAVLAVLTYAVDFWATMFGDLEHALPDASRSGVDLHLASATAIGLLDVDRQQIAVEPLMGTGRGLGESEDLKDLPIKAEQVLADDAELRVPVPNLIHGRILDQRGRRIVQVARSCQERVSPGRRVPGDR
jgi:hypothetical protein